jgi:inhibitor of cysteine peptidase
MISFKTKMPVFFSLLALLSLVITSSCHCGADQDGTEIALAPIHEVRVNIAESYPEKIFIYIEGGLKDSCTTFHDIETQRNGNTIDITVTTQRPRDAVCAQVYSYFEENVALGSDFISGETYTVNVNDVTASFEYP